MAQKYLVQVIDDLDGTELDSDDVEQVHFGLDGTAYVIDLSRGNAARLRDVLTLYTDAARRDQTAARAAAASSTRGSGSGSGSSPAKRKDLDEVRAWANSNGYTVSSRGRVPGEVLQAYDNR